MGRSISWSGNHLSKGKRVAELPLSYPFWLIESVLLQHNNESRKRRTASSVIPFFPTSSLYSVMAHRTINGRYTRFIVSATTTTICAVWLLVLFLAVTVTVYVPAVVKVYGKVLPTPTTTSFTLHV